MKTRHDNDTSCDMNNGNGKEKSFHRVFWEVKCIGIGNQLMWGMKENKT